MCIIIIMIQLLMKQAKFEPQLMKLKTVYPKSILQFESHQCSRDILDISVIDQIITYKYIFIIVSPMYI